MNVTFYVSVGKKYDMGLADAFCKGVRDDGHIVSVEDIRAYKRHIAKTDVAVVAGVKGVSKECFAQHRAMGKRAIIIDKGYIRVQGGSLKTLYWRVSVDEFQPTSYLDKFKCPRDRWDAVELELKPWSEVHSNKIVFAGSSQKYCNWHDIGDATRYARVVLKEIRRRTSDILIYRPKPSWGGKKRITGFIYSGPEEKLRVLLGDCRLLVTFGSNAAVESIINGVPAIVLGDGVAGCVSSTTLDDIHSPRKCTRKEKLRWLSNLCYFQWSLKEMERGQCWKMVKRIMETI